MVRTNDDITYELSTIKANVEINVKLELVIITLANRVLNIRVLRLGSYHSSPTLELLHTLSV